MRFKWHWEDLEEEEEEWEEPRIKLHRNNSEAQ